MTIVKLFLKILLKFLTNSLKTVGMQGKSHDTWFFQRFSSLLMIFLIPWLYLFGLGDAGSKDYHEFQAWLQSPLNASLLALTIICMFSHARLGLETIIKDYIHQEIFHNLSIYIVRIICKTLMISGVLAILYSTTLGHMVMGR